MSIKRILLLPHLVVQNANALSSPYTIGFPAMTAWLGAVHALERNVNQIVEDKVRFVSVGVVSHTCNLQTYKGRGDYVSSIIGTGNPLDKDGTRPAFIEEARCHLNVSLVIECEGVGVFTQEEQLHVIRDCLHARMKIAGGDLLDFDNPEIISVSDEADRRRLMRRLMPGFALVERRGLIEEAMRDGQDAIDALLDYLTVKHRSEVDNEGNVCWTSRRKAPGWIVPIATGFQGLTEPGNYANQRDPTTEHRFAESVVTLGEFVMPYRIDDLDDLLWTYHFDEENDLYLCRQKNQLVPNN